MFNRRKGNSPAPAAPAPQATAPAPAPGGRTRVTDARVQAALADLEKRRAGHGTTEPAAAPAATPEGFLALSHWYASGGRMDQAALAMWIHDLRTMQPMLRAGSPGLLQQVASDAGNDPYGTLDRARVHALDALFAAGARTADVPDLPSPAHITNVPSSEDAAAPVLANYDDLRATADHLMRRAIIGPEGPEVARRDARKSDLAALDALLLRSALRAGDVAGVSIELRRTMASSTLTTLDPQLRNLPLAEEVRRVRTALRSVVEPHEVPGLDQAFAPEPQ